MSGTQQSPNLTQVVVALQELIKASYLTEQQIEALVGKLSVAGTLSGPVATSATAGSATLPAAPAAFGYVTIGSSTYKIPLYNP